MPSQRFFIDAELNENQNLTISGKEFLHIVSVMRNKEKSSIEIVNGKEQLAKGIITKIEKTYLLLNIQEVILKKNLDKIIIYQALVPSNRLETIIEKGTELGITSFYLFPGDKSIKKNISKEQINRLKLITISAIKQCGRLDLPQISLLPPIKDWKKNNIPLPLFFGNVNACSPKLTTALISKDNFISYAIGPEGGFSQQELQTLETLNILGVNIHPYILRTETAAIAFAALAKHLIS